MKAGANLDAQNGSGMTALHIACFLVPGGDLYTTMAEILVHAGANVHAMDERRLFSNSVGYKILLRSRLDS